jgi:hypothetical protein
MELMILGRLRWWFAELAIVAQKLAVGVRFGVVSVMERGHLKGIDDFWLDLRFPRFDDFG